MTGIAYVAAINVCRALATDGNAVMTKGTVIHKISVIDIRRHPRRRSMTIITLLGGNNMGGRLAAGDNVIVATGTGANHLGMIHRTCRNRYPRYRPRLMTGIAGIRGINMARRFPRCGYTIMTADTGAG